mgnify:CR=1 FL=1
MNMEIKARDLIAAGSHEGRRLGAALRRARDLESTGLARADVLTALEAEFPKQLPVILPRYEPAPLAEAIEVDKFELLGCWLREQLPDLHALFEELRARCDVTPAEQRLLAYCRKLAGDREAAPFIIDGRSVVALLVR